MSASPGSPANMNLVTKDAMFLFDLFRESPTPILIQIGPFAEKTGAKPNTIIKRLAGIKARNGLNISTTLGNYKRPSPSVDGDFKLRSIKKTLKRENHQPGPSHATLGLKNEDTDVVNANGDGFGSGLETWQIPPSPAHAPFAAISSSSDSHENWEIRPNEDLSLAPDSANLNLARPKRDFQQTLDDEFELSQAELDGTSWKRFKVE